VLIAVGGRAPAGAAAARAEVFVAVVVHGSVGTREGEAAATEVPLAAVVRSDVSAIACEAASAEEFVLVAVELVPVEVKIVLVAVVVRHAVCALVPHPAVDAAEGLPTRLRSGVVTGSTAMVATVVVAFGQKPA